MHIIEVPSEESTFQLPNGCFLTFNELSCHIIYIYIYIQLKYPLLWLHIIYRILEAQTPSIEHHESTIYVVSTMEEFQRHYNFENVHIRSGRSVGVPSPPYKCKHQFFKSQFTTIISILRVSFRTLLLYSAPLRHSRTPSRKQSGG